MEPRPLRTPPYVLWLEWQGFYADDSLGTPQAVVRDRRVLDANRFARRRGVHPGMTTSEARNVVPELVQTLWRKEDFAPRQHAWLDLCVPFTSRIEPIDAHVAALDLTDHPRPLEIAERLTETLVGAVGLPLRAGAGPSKWVAALAASHRDLYRAVADAGAFLAPLPLDRLSVLDAPVRERLTFLGHRTAGEVARLPLPVLRAQFGEAAWRILQAARGTLTDPVVPAYPRDAVVAALAFEGSLETWPALDEGLARLAGELAESLAHRNAAAKRIDLTLGHEGYPPTVADRTFARPLTTLRDLHGALRLMLPEPPRHPVARLQVVLPELRSAQRVQLNLDARRDESDASLRACVQNVRTVFGEAAVRTGAEIALPRWQRVRRAYRDAYGWAWV